MTEDAGVELLNHRIIALEVKAAQTACIIEQLDKRIKHLWGYIEAKEGGCRE